VWPEVFCQRKIPTPSGIEPATFRLVVEHIKQLRHRVPQPREVITDISEKHNFLCSYPEYGDTIFFRNVGNHITDQTVS
jgi:hypothetical protein